MGKKLYIGNLSYSTTSSDLEALLGAHGTVLSAEVISDRTTGQSKGFGFVEMNSDEEAQAKKQERERQRGPVHQPRNERGGDQYDRDKGESRRDVDHRPGG